MNHLLNLNREALQQFATVYGLCLLVKVLRELPYSYYVVRQLTTRIIITGVPLILVVSLLKVHTQ